MDRRRFLELLGTSGIGGLAGCGGRQDTPGTASTEVTSRTRTVTTPSTESPTDTPTNTAVPAEFVFRDLQHPDTIKRGETVKIQVDVTNSGGRQGRTVVYLEFNDIQLTRDIQLAPGGVETLTFEFEVKAVPGTHEVLVFETEPGEVLRGEIRVKKKHPDLIVVGPDGDDDNIGSKDLPLATIQTAIDRAKPGETVSVLPGEYHESFRTKRNGKPGKPITITGPKDAVVRPHPDRVQYGMSGIYHSHIHLTGLSFSGLADPDQPENPDLYASQPINARPPTWQDSYPDYLSDIKIKPHAIGNAGKRFVNVFRVNDIEIGEFLVTAPAGKKYELGQLDGFVIGEIVSLGRSSNNFGTEGYPWEGPDESHDVHVHHIANLDGYAHTELVKTHGGMYDVTIEYCTDNGGFSREGSPGTGSGVFIPSAKTTVRWCKIQNGDGPGVFVFVPSMKENGSYAEFSELPDARFPGKNNSIYGNHLLDNGGRALQFSSPDWFDGGPEAQRVICGNEFTGETHGDPDKSCPEDVPAGDGVGHTGGDSPWQ